MNQLFKTSKDSDDFREWERDFIERKGYIGHTELLKKVQEILDQKEY